MGRQLIKQFVRESLKFDVYNQGICFGSRKWKTCLPVCHVQKYMGFLPDSHSHKLMINYSMTKLSPNPLFISMLSRRGNVDQMDGQTNGQIQIIVWLIKELKHTGITYYYLMPNYRVFDIHLLAYSLQAASSFLNWVRAIFHYSLMKHELEREPYQKEVLLCWIRWVTLWSVSWKNHITNTQYLVFSMGL